MTAISATRRQMKEMADGTIRVQVDIDPAFRAAFLQAFPSIDMPIALAPLVRDFERRPETPKEQKGGAGASEADRGGQQKDAADDAADCDDAMDPGQQGRHRQRSGLLPRGGIGGQFPSGKVPGDDGRYLIRPCGQAIAALEAHQLPQRVVQCRSGLADRIGAQGAPDDRIGVPGDDFRAARTVQRTVRSPQKVGRRGRKSGEERA